MRIFDRNYRLFGLINVVDLVVIIAVLVAGFAIYRVLFPADKASTSAATKEITYTVLCPSTRGLNAGQIKVGDSIFKNNGKPVGKVTAVKELPTPGEAWDVQTSKIRPYDSTVFKDIYIDCTVQGTPTKTGFAVGDLVLHGGQPLPIMTSTFQCDTAAITTMTVAGQ